MIENLWRLLELWQRELRSPGSVSYHQELQLCGAENQGWSNHNLKSETARLRKLEMELRTACHLVLRTWNETEPEPNRTRTWFSSSPSSEFKNFSWSWSGLCDLSSSHISRDCRNKNHDLQRIVRLRLLEEENQLLICPRHDVSEPWNWRWKW